jgi:predicted dehydrogenase
VVSFPLRLTNILQYVKKILDSGRIGEIAHIQAYNNVPYGRGYYHKWYRDESETGGLFLQKATHDLDYINYILGNIRPTAICAMKSKQIFGGNKPAGLKCADCDEKDTCLDSPKNIKKTYPDAVLGEYCCFAEDTGNEDSGSMIVRYGNGMHAVYSQNFIVRGDAGKRGARFVGYLGTLEFDFASGTVVVYHHMDRITETHKFDTSAASHFGGDAALAENFAQVMLGAESSMASLDDGILSAEMCLAARKSSEEDLFIHI